MPDTSQPYLDSQSIYSFDLDKRTLTFCDYDLFAPARNLVLHMGFTVKKIAAAVSDVKRCELRRVRATATSLDDAFKRSTKVPKEEARVEIVDGSVNFKISNKLHVGAQDALLLALEYTIDLPGKGEKLLFSGAIQPSDYRNIHNSLRVRDILKDVVLQASSVEPFSVRIFNASKPLAFPESIDASKRRPNSTSYSIRQSLSLKLDDWERALYFSIAQD